MEAGARARRAVDADLAAHLLDQALGNHQAQPGAAGLARQRVVGLAEGLEQRALVFVGQRGDLLARGVHRTLQFGTPGVPHQAQRCRVMRGL